MKAQGHSIPFNAAASLVARSARSGEIVRVDNVRQTPDWLPNPLLPETYSEMAVPITLEGKVVGVLDVQQNQVAGLDEGDAALLRSLANQVAIAINNARLFEEVETALAEAREAERRYIQQSWDASAMARRGAGRVQFSLGESTTLSETILAKARQQAFTQTEPSVVSIDERDEAVLEEQLNETEEAAVAVDPADKHHILVAPIALGETKIGNLQLHEVDPDQQWSEGDLALISAVIDQVAQTAENLRLLNETQERASREQLISQVSDKLRRAPDMEALMKLATSEISRVLNPARTFIKFDTNTDEGLGNHDEVVPTSDNGNSDVDISQVEDDSVITEEPLDE
jgi:GAF domain-containing protein